MERIRRRFRPGKLMSQNCGMGTKDVAVERIMTICFVIAIG
jgi:hypothetical protein